MGQQAPLVVPVHDREAVREAHEPVVAAQPVVADRVEGAAHDLGKGPLEQVRGPGEHLPGGLAGEGEEQDIFRVHPLIHQISQTVHQGAGLAAPRPGDDQHRPICLGDGLVLGRVELALIVDAAGRPAG